MNKLYLVNWLSNSFLNYFYIALLLIPNKFLGYSYDDKFISYLSVLSIFLTVLFLTKFFLKPHLKKKHILLITFFLISVGFYFIGLIINGFNQATYSFLIVFHIFFYYSLFKFCNVNFIQRFFCFFVPFLVLFLFGLKHIDISLYNIIYKDYRLLVIVSIIFLYCKLITTNMNTFSYYLLLFLICFEFSYLAFSWHRSYFISVIMFFLFATVCYPKKTLQIFCIIFTLIVLIGPLLLLNTDLSSDFMLSSISRIINFNEFNSTILYRLQHWDMVLTNHFFFGVGFGEYLMFDPLLNGELSYYPIFMIHNFWISLFSIGGLFYFFIFISFYFSLFVKIRSDFFFPYNAILLCYIVVSFFGVGLALSKEAFLLFTILSILKFNNESS